MFDIILQTLRENKIATGILLTIIYVMIFGFEALGYVLAAEAFIFAYVWIITSGDDDDDDGFGWISRDARFA